MEMKLRVIEQEDMSKVGLVPLLVESNPLAGAAKGSFDSGEEEISLDACAKDLVSTLPNDSHVCCHVPSHLGGTYLA